jgi:hypothetical protein
MLVKRIVCTGKIDTNQAYLFHSHPSICAASSGSPDLAKDPKNDPKKDRRANALRFLPF